MSSHTANPLEEGPFASVAERTWSMGSRIEMMSRFNLDSIEVSNESSPCCFHYSVSSAASDTSLELLVARRTIGVREDPFLDPPVSSELPSMEVITRRQVCVPPLSVEVLEEFIQSCEASDVALCTPVRRNVERVVVEPVPLPTRRPPFAPTEYARQKANLDAGRYGYFAEGWGSTVRLGVPKGRRGVKGRVVGEPLEFATDHRIFHNDAEKLKVMEKAHVANLSQLVTFHSRFMAKQAHQEAVERLHVYYPMKIPTPPKSKPQQFEIEGALLVESEGEGSDESPPSPTVMDSTIPGYDNDAAPPGTSDGDESPPNSMEADEKPDLTIRMSASYILRGLSG